MLHSVKASVQRACLEARFDGLLLNFAVDIQAHLAVSALVAMAVAVEAFAQATLLLP